MTVSEQSTTTKPAADPNLVYVNGIDFDTGQVRLRAAVDRRDRKGGAQPSRVGTIHMTCVPTSARFALPFGVDLEKPEEAGWGIIFHEDTPQDMRKALEPLIEHRRKQVPTIWSRSSTTRRGSRPRNWYQRHRDIARQHRSGNRSVTTCCWSAARADPVRVPVSARRRILRSAASRSTPPMNTSATCARSSPMRAATPSPTPSRSPIGARAISRRSRHQAQRLAPDRSARQRHPRTPPARSSARSSRGRLQSQLSSADEATKANLLRHCSRQAARDAVHGVAWHGASIRPGRSRLPPRARCCARTGRASAA